MSAKRLLFVAGLGIAGLALARRARQRNPPVSDEAKRRWMDPGPLRPLRLQVRGICMHALAAVQGAPPDAPAVVLVHGSGLSHRYMIPTATRLAQRFRVYLPDLPGYGESDKPNAVFDVPALADWIADWMRSAGLERASFLGNSFGCQVIAELAARHPGRVERAILQGPTTPPDERSIPWQFVRWRQNQRHNPEWLGEVTAEAYRQAGRWRLLRSFFIQIGDPVEEKMPHIQAPVLVVRGSEDPIANQPWCERLAGLCPQGRLAVVPGVAHTMCFTAPAPLAALTRQFILDEGRFSTARPHSPPRPV